MNYLIVQEWENTMGNHAGMKHMCDLLVEKYPECYKMLVKPIPRKFRRTNNKFRNLYNKWFSKIYTSYIYAREYRKLCKQMFAELIYGDNVFLLEYLTIDYPQRELAQYIHKHFPGIKVYALAHLTPSYYRGYPDAKKIISEWISDVDKILTLGSSLSTYYEEIGIETAKICTGFHYVDSDYYQPKLKQLICERIRIICIGSLQRDFELLAEIVKKTPDVDWIICKGRKDVDRKFTGLHNVTLKDFLTEEEMRELMNDADISLNVLEDTVGSNVITTSMAMGLGIIVSDVGSIRNYCGNDNAIFCINTVESFVSAINTLICNKKRIEEMKDASIKRIDKLKIDKVHNWLTSIR